MNNNWAFLIILFVSCNVLAQPGVGSDFLEIIANRSNLSIKKAASDKPTKSVFQHMCPIDKSAVAKRILSEYGAIFVASDRVTPPPTCWFQNDTDVTEFQSKLETALVPFDGLQVRLQKAAAESLNSIIVEALANGLRIRPFDGLIAGGRSYSDTLRLWNSRFEPSLRFWVARNRISAEEAGGVTQMTLEEKIAKAMEWEDEGIRFGTNHRASIFASTAPPGASQHISLIAIDLAPPLTPALMALMNSHGWFQTVKGDRPHFTYLGLTEKELPGRGLKALIFDGTQYWVPNIIS